MIYFTSDLHLCHNQDFIYKPRGFDNVHDMNAAIIKNWNSVVQPDDDVYVLGDLMMGPIEDSLPLVKQLKGNIHIIRGNHDTDARIAAYDTCYNIVEIVDAKYIKISKSVMAFLVHYPAMINRDSPRGNIFCICGHSHTQDKFVDKHMNCVHIEMDCRNNTPVSFEQVKKEIYEILEENNKKEFR